MIGPQVRDISLLHLLFQSANASLVGRIGYRHQLGVQLTLSHHGEPNSQVLIKPQMFKLNRYRRKAGPPIVATMVS